MAVTAAMNRDLQDRFRLAARYPVAAAAGGDWRASLLGVRDRVERATGTVVVRWFGPVIGLILVGALAMTLVAYGFSIVVD